MIDRVFEHLIPAGLIQRASPTEPKTILKHWTLEETTLQLIASTTTLSYFASRLDGSSCEESETKPRATSTEMSISTKDLGFDPNGLKDRYRKERDARLRKDGNNQYISRYFWRFRVKDQFLNSSVSYFAILGPDST